MEGKYNTIKWSCSVGVNSGYDLEDQVRMPIEQLADIYLQIAEDVMGETGVYISAAISESRLLYSPKWGCPRVGEYAYTLSGSCNPEFAEKESYLEALDMVAERLKERLKQSTLLLEIMPAGVRYFKDIE